MKFTGISLSFQSRNLLEISFGSLLYFCPEKEEMDMLTAHRSFMEWVLKPVRSKK